MSTFSTKNSDVLQKAVIRSVLLTFHDRIRHVVQVGACDGIAFDFYNAIWNIFKWPTTFVEPHPVLFGKLQETYAEADESCTFVNGAIDVTTGQKTMFQNLDDIFYGNSSFYQDVCPGGEPIDIQTYTWDHVLTPTTDLVIIDAEGHDSVLVKNLLTYATPKLIIWEATRVSDMDNLLTTLKAAGYKSIKGDTTGYNYISVLQPPKQEQE